MSVLNKASLITILAEKNGSTKAEAERFLVAFQDAVVDAVAAGDEVKLTGFAAFTPVTRAARVMKSPRTGEDIQVAEAKSVKIRPLKSFRDAITGAESTDGE